MKAIIRLAGGGHRLLTAGLLGTAESCRCRGQRTRTNARTRRGRARARWPREKKAV